MGTRMAWSLLCTYLRGEPRNLEPLSTYKNAPRQKRVHSYIVDREATFGFPLLLKSNYSKRSFLGCFGKCEIIS